MQLFYEERQHEKLEKSGSLGKRVKYVEIISSHFSHARIDFYNINGKIIFEERYMKYGHDELYFEIIKKINIEQIKKRKIMNKIIVNIFAYIRGILFKRKNILKNNFSVGNKIRILKNVRINAYRGSHLKIGNKAKIDIGSVIVSCNNAKIFIGENVGIGTMNRIISREKIEIGDNTILGPNVMIYDHDHLFDFKTGVKIREYVTSSIEIGKNCWIGANSIILRGTKIGDNCLIAAGSIVKGTIPSNSKYIQKKETKIIGSDGEKSG